MSLPEHRQSAVHILAPTFTLHEDRLAVLTTWAEGKHSLPNTYLRADHPDLPAVTRQALYSAFGDAQPTLEPVTTYIRSESKNDDIEIGYAALARLVDISSNPALIPVPLPHIEGRSLGLTDIEIEFTKLGLEAFRKFPNISWSARLQHPDTLPRLARLVENPRRFTIAELRVAYEALLYDTMDPSGRPQSAEDYIDPANFQRTVRDTPIVPLSEQYVGKGRPASLWTMPPAVLTGNTTR
ncbi:MAG TPA: hypothetical protein VLG11_01360 [Candidatus Saccharimonadales bacterium]|nr:hypothetical protein [Candidatus Saccharimonadales bacterium]